MNTAKSSLNKKHQKTRILQQANFLRLQKNKLFYSLYNFWGEAKRDESSNANVFCNFMIGIFKLLTTKID